MNTSTLSHIPLSLGAGIAALAARGGQWCIARMISAPMSSTAFVLVSGLTLMAGANAVYFQDARHPAPMFVAAPHAASPAPAQLASPPPVPPVVTVPTERPAELAVVAPQPAATPAPAAPATTGSIGNADIAMLQEKLKAMGLFEGTVDGYYGPKTADAIRAFEQRAGLPRTGAASPQVIEAVRNASVNTSQASPIPSGPVTAEPEREDLGNLIAELTTTTPAPAQAVPQPIETIAAIAPLEPAPAPQATQAIPPAIDRELVSEIQLGLSRLGFLQAPVDGIAGESTALAIRKFQVFNNFRATGEVSPAVLDMLVAAGAYR